MRDEIDIARDLLDGKAVSGDDLKNLAATYLAHHEDDRGRMWFKFYIPQHFAPSVAEELTALAACAEFLDKLDADAKARACAWLVGRYQEARQQEQ